MVGLTKKVFYSTQRDDDYYADRGLDAVVCVRSRALMCKHLRRRGIAHVWVAVLIVFIVLLVGLSLDTARVYLVGQQLQNTADAAALAGARTVKIDQAESRLQAIAFAFANFADKTPVLLADNPDNLPDGDVVIGRYSRLTQVFTPTTQAANALKVVASRTQGSLNGPVSLNFGVIVGVNTADVSRYAIAMASGGTGAGLIALAPDGTGLTVKGNFTLDVNDGAMQVNSGDDEHAVNIDGQPELQAGELNVLGNPGIDATGGFEFDPDLAINPGYPPSPDPLCPDPEGGDCLPPPTWDPCNDLAPSPGEPLVFDENSPSIDPNTGNMVLNPGFYSGGFYFTGGNVILKPGIYVLDGGDDGKGGLVVLGNTNLCAKGVMFYITGTGKVNIGGTGDVRVTPIVYDSNDFCDASYAYPAGVDYMYEGVTIFQDRENENDAYIKGTGLLDLDGTLYFPRCLVNIRGEGDGFGNQLITWRADVRGTGDILINYDGSFPAPANRSFLVK